MAIFSTLNESSILEKDENNAVTSGEEWRHDRVTLLITSLVTSVVCVPGILLNALLIKTIKSSPSLKVFVHLDLNLKG